MDRLTGKLGAVHVIRADMGEDLLEALQQGVRDAGTRQGAILQGVGSLAAYRVHVVGEKSHPVPNLFLGDRGGYDILSVQGYVLDGRVHAHISVSDTERAIGGHLEPGCEVYTFALVTVVELDSIDLTDLDRAHRATD